MMDEKLQLVQKVEDYMDEIFKDFFDTRSADAVTLSEISQFVQYNLDYMKLKGMICSYTSVYFGRDEGDVWSIEFSYNILYGSRQFTYKYSWSQNR